MYQQIWQQQALVPVCVALGEINPIPRGISELRKRAGGGGFRPPTMISSPEHILQAITLFISFLDSPIKYLAGHIHFFVIA